MSWFQRRWARNTYAKGKVLGIPSYADRDITEGSIYHILMHGINLMGSHASQVDQLERWQISQYVLELRKELLK